ncbi:hypothetical protein Tco_0604861 [Tanacetum coccineum]
MKHQNPPLFFGKHTHKRHHTTITTITTTTTSPPPSSTPQQLGVSIGLSGQVMAAPVISISSDSSEESVGSHVPRVILFGTIPTSIPVIHMVPVEVPIAPANLLVAPEVGAVYVISLTGVLDLVDYSSSSDSDPSEDSLPVALELPLFHPSYVLMTQGWTLSLSLLSRDPRGMSLLYHNLSFHLHLLLSHPGFVNGQRFLSDSVRLSPSVDLTAPILMGRVSYSSSSGSFSDSSSDTSSGQSHSGSSTRVASPGLVDPPVRTPRCSEAFMRYKSTPLSTLYPPTTSESSPDSSFERSLDSSSPSVRPSRKRCRSPTTLVSSSTPVLRSIALALANLYPRKRFRHSYSFEASKEEHMEIGTADEETVADLGIIDGVGAHTEDGICMGVEVATSDIRDDEEEFEAEASAGGTMEIAVDPLATGGISEPTGEDAPDLEGTLYDTTHYMSEVPFNRINEFETA